MPDARHAREAFLLAIPESTQSLPHFMGFYIIMPFLEGICIDKITTEMWSGRVPQGYAHGRLKRI
jgi:hypothetical protein